MDAKYLRAKDIMVTDVKTIGKDATLLEAAGMMKNFGVSSLVVEPGGDWDAIAIITRKDIVEASSGKPGMRLQRENPADLVISDLIMPEQEGIETIMELRREFPETKILAISGGGTNRPEDYLLIARGVGAHQVLKKPFKRAELLRAVEDLLNQ